MPDDKSKRGSPDNRRLNKSEPYEVAYARKKAGAARAQGNAALDGSMPRPSPRSPKPSAGTEKTVTNTAPAAARHDREARRVRRSS